MEEKKKKTILYLLICLAIIILVGVGSTFAYFSATVGSEEEAVSTTAAEFKIGYTDDKELIKSHLIPSEEQYVDKSLTRYDDKGNLLKPDKKEDGSWVDDKRGTVCVDDNNNDICSVYSFTISNEITENTLPIYITMKTSVNNFENLYYKVLDSEYNEIISATRLQDDRYQTNDETGEFLKDETGNLIPKENFEKLTITPTSLTNANTTLAKATMVDGVLQPSSVTYHFVVWIMETHNKQNESDGGKVFAGTMYVSASSKEGTGITGMISAAGVE